MKRFDRFDAVDVAWVLATFAVLGFLVWMTPSNRIRGATAGRGQPAWLVRRSRPSGGGREPPRPPTSSLERRALTLEQRMRHPNLGRQ